MIRLVITFNSDFSSCRGSLAASSFLLPKLLYLCNHIGSCIQVTSG